jgi:hypothetical protein
MDIAEIPQTPPPLVIDLPLEGIGARHGVTLPGFTARLELTVANGCASSRPGVTDLRVCAAALGLCTRIGRITDADRRPLLPSYVSTGCDVLAYGGAVYDLLASRGVTPRALRAAAAPILALILENLPPLDPVIEDKAAFSEGGGASTAGPSASR